MNGCCDTWCEGCEFLAKSADVYCDYICVMARRRPCRAGKGCTERRRPPKYRHDPRLAILEKETMEVMKAQKPKHERAGRPSQYGGISLTPEYAAAQQAKRRERILRENRLRAEAQAIRAWREARGLTQKQLGAMVGLTASAVFGWEAGYCGAKWDALEKLGCRRPAAS